MKKKLWTIFPLLIVLVLLTAGSTFTVYGENDNTIDVPYSSLTFQTIGVIIRMISVITNTPVLSRYVTCSHHLNPRF